MWDIDVDYLFFRNNFATPEKLKQKYQQYNPNKTSILQLFVIYARQTVNNNNKKRI